MRTSERKLNSILKKRIEKTLAQIIADIKTQDNATTFLGDFLTNSELETFAKRLAVAYWLKKGRSYDNIKENLKVSSATVATIQNSINKKGYQIALKQLEAEEWANVWSRKIQKLLGK